MKLKLMIPAFALLFFLSIQSKAQFTFSLATGLQHNSGTFGYKFNKFVPQLNLQMMHAGSTVTSEGKENDPMTDEIVPFSHEYKFNATIYMPSIGFKYFLIERGNLKAYANLSFTKVILSAKIEDDEYPDANKDLQEELNNTKIFGGQTGFGTEYFFDPHFSIGGEFGFMMLKVNYKSEFDRELFDPNTLEDVTVKIEQAMNLNLSPTYGKMSLNFYFGK